MTSQQSPRPRRGGASRGADRSPAAPVRGIHATVLGGVVMVLAPLFGFLGGSMTGAAGDLGAPDPLVLWLAGGLVVGGAGGVVAILGALRWARSSAQARADRP